MLYRKFQKAPMDLSILGFGCMRLPVLENRQIDEPKATEMIRYAIDHGVNYIDTAYPYHDGESEPVVGRALRDGYREKVYLATKLPSWLITKREDMDRYLDEQLARIATDHIDFYLIHGLNQATWENTARLGVLEFLDEAVADDRIRYLPSRSTTRCRSLRRSSMRTTGHLPRSSTTSWTRTTRQARKG